MKVKDGKAFYGKGKKKIHSEEGKSNYLVSLSVMNHLEEVMQKIYFFFCKPSTISCDSVNFVS